MFTKTPLNSWLFHCFIFLCYFFISKAISVLSKVWLSLLSTTSVLAKEENKSIMMETFPILLYGQEIRGKDRKQKSIFQQGVKFTNIRKKLVKKLVKVYQYNNPGHCLNVSDNIKNVSSLKQTSAFMIKGEMCRETFHI